MAYPEHFMVCILNIQSKGIFISEYAAFMILEAETMNLLDFDARDLRGC